MRHCYFYTDLLEAFSTEAFEMDCWAVVMNDVPVSTFETITKAFENRDTLRLERCDRFKKEGVEMTKKKTKERTITGIVIPEDWDDNDNVIRVAIKTLDYVEYVVERNIKGKELLALVDEKVRATGTIRERVHGDMIISVKRYEQIKEGEYEEDYA